MENAMPPEDRSEPPGDFDAQIASLHAAANSLGEERPSWFDNIFHPGRQARRQAEFSVAVVAALKEIGATMRKVTANISERERHLSNLEAEIAQLRERQEQLARESASAAEVRQQFEQLAREEAERIEQLVRTHGDLGNELRERIQHVLDEQRVAIRQVSLKASEDAILSDRARRATELKLEELAKRVPPPPA
jgi:vacuolar-type H+-ATPase subunit I/STV1